MLLKTSATIENTATRKDVRVVEPLTNYNVLVLDQQTKLICLSTQTQPEMGALETLTSLLYYLT
jgi:hypothetical protein